MNEDMQVAWLEISQMLGETDQARSWMFSCAHGKGQVQATRKALAEQPAQRTWVGLTR
jgi:hypothetical protein